MAERGPYDHLPAPPVEDHPISSGTDDGTDPTEGRARNVARGILILAAATGLGIFMLGFPAGILPALATIIYFLAPNETSRAASLAALVLLAVAGIATLAEGSLDADDLSLRFARDREIATTAAAAAGGLLGIAVLTGAVVERSALRAKRWVPPRRHRRAHDGPDARVLGVSLVLGALVRLVAAPGAFGPDGTIVLRNLADGIAFDTGLADRVLVPPLAPLLATILPVGEGVLLLGVGLGIIAAAVRMGRRLAGDRGALAAGLVAACLPALFGQRLPEALATLLVTLAVLMAWPALLTTRRSLLAGGLLGLAVLAEPTTLLAVAVLVVWVATSEQDDRASYSLFLVVPVILLAAPLLQWTLAELGTAFPRSPADGAAWSGAPRIGGYLLDAAAGIACFVAASDHRNRLILRLLPALALVAGLLTGSSSGLWGWSAGIVAVGAAAFLARVAEHPLPSEPADPTDEVTAV